MRPRRFPVYLILALGCFFGCNAGGDDILVTDEPIDNHGVNYVYDGRTIPEVHIQVSLGQWNTLLKAYDKDSGTKEHIKCDVTYIKLKDTTVIKEAGLRLKGNTSRRRPEGESGQLHSATNPKWRHCHYDINFHKWHKDAEHKLHGAERISFKWYKDDPAYVRENFCYDLFRRFGVWTASHTAYARLFIKVQGDSKEYYLGIYDMIEPVADDYLKVRDSEDMFGFDGGYLWRCRWGARFNSVSANMGPDLDNGKEYTYELKTNVEAFENAQAQLKDFINKTLRLQGQEFRSWFSTHCDVDLLLRTYAVNVAVGMWDDYWNNCNNFYIYFNSTEPQSYKFYFIPYDYDNTLGTTSWCGVQSDAGRHDPLNWGDSKMNPLINKILQVEDWRRKYKDYLLELASESNTYLNPSASADRIRNLQNMIRLFVPNDTGEDMSISDRPAPWSSHGEYRLLQMGNDNYFTVKTNSIKQYCK